MFRSASDPGVSNMRAIASVPRILLWGLLAVVALPAQDWLEGLQSPEESERVKAVRAMAKSPDGFRYMDQLPPLLRDDSEAVRVEVVNALIRMRSIEAQPMLITATSDTSPNVQASAVDGLVSLYVPDYVKLGRLAALKSVASSLKARFSKPSPLVVSAYVNVSPAALEAIANVLIRGGGNEAKANAARALGVLRGAAHTDALLEGARSRDSTTIIESVLAIKKLQATSVGPDIVFLLRDPALAVQEAAIVTAGQLRTREAVPQLVEISNESRKARIRALALTALAKIPDNGQRRLFTTFLSHKDKLMRAAAAEGLGRIGNRADARVVDHQFSIEKAEGVRLSLAFAGVLLGNPLRISYLIEGLNSTTRRLEARPFLVELARDPEILSKLYIPLTTGTVPQRRHLAFVLSESGTQESIPHLENLTRDGIPEVAAAAVEALRVLRARL